MPATHLDTYIAIQSCGRVVRFLHTNTVTYTLTVSFIQ